MSFHPAMPYGTGEWHRSQRKTLPEGPEFQYTPENRNRFEEFATHYPPEFRKAAIAAWQSEASPTDASGRPNVRLAPSLNGVSRSNAQLRADMQADMPDEALFDSTLARRR